jgi:proteasome lid subunit RPN8/RPN11
VGYNLLILRIRRHHIDLLKQETKRIHPIEACAMLFGKMSQNEAVVEKVEFAPKKSQSLVRFEIGPEKVADVFTEAEEEGLDFIGLFHSHPAPADPSSIDLRYMKFWGNAISVILSSLNGKLAAYQLTDGSIEEATIQIG